MTNSDNQLNDYQKYIHQSRYARFLPDEQRRETWPETVARYCNFWRDRFGDLFPYESAYNGILNLELMPSMRCLMTAGEALDRDNIAGYNCSFLPIDHPRAFDEVMYILMCGTGVGFSVEQQYVGKLPEIAEAFHQTDTTLVVSDSRIGWASSFRELISLLYSGRVPGWNLERIRPKGAPLHTFGGRASGPEPLGDLFNFTVQTFTRAAGRRLTSLECHDLVCKIADIVVVGGVRRSALISLSDIGDEKLRVAKSGAWWLDNVQRALANNSAVYDGPLDTGTFLKEWYALYESKSGERGIFNRAATRDKVKSHGRRNSNIEFGTNPCGEIILRPNGLCNLTEAVIRSTDSLEDIRKKVRLASILGTFQSTLTEFRYLRPIWKKNAEEERLLGVSLTGIMGHGLFNKPSEELKTFLEELREYAIETNADWARELGIGPSLGVTTVKPSGTVSQLVGSSSGIHPYYSRYYVRTVRTDAKDPIGHFLKDQGVYAEADVTKPNDMTVFSFPIKVEDEAAVFRNDVTAIEQLELYKIYRDHWCEHNPSITVYVGDDEWLDVAAWVFRNFSSVSGVSFLPRDNGSYRQAPYQEIDEKRYNELKWCFPKIDWSKLKGYENEFSKTGTHELSCSAGVCEIAI